MPYSAISKEQEDYLLGLVDNWLHEMDKSTPRQLLSAGFLYPEGPPSIWDKLPDEWDELMDRGGITTLTDASLEEYLERWGRLLGHAYWVQGLWEDRFNVLTRAYEYVKDFIFSHASGGREQKDAVAGSHPITLQVLDMLIEAERKKTELNGLIKKWDKTEFSISRAITNRQGRSYR